MENIKDYKEILQEIEKCVTLDEVKEIDNYFFPIKKKYPLVECQEVYRIMFTKMIEIAPELVS